MPAKLPQGTPFGDTSLFAQNAKTVVLQKQLESDNNTYKLEALKRIVAMIARGKDAAELFPFVVKNVISNTLEIKKLVYIILCHYAEEKPDEALLSIAHFQKDLVDKNQFIRASALRVLSSIRVDMITQIIMIAIKKSAADSSPYVRKTAAIAIPKIYSLNEDEKGGLIGIVEQLLNDRNTIVLGAAVYAFNEVCPEDYEMLHKQYRKICRYMVDCDEWGQVFILNVLLRYARTNFVSPFGEGWQKKLSFYDPEEDEEEDEEDNIFEYDMDQDHRLLLRCVLPLLSSSNSATVLGVASLYFHCAPMAEFSVVVKSLIRIMRTEREGQYIILNNIATMAADRPAPFKPFLKNFFVKVSDPIFIRELKLKIMAILSDDSNAPTVLREFRSYLKHTDKTFVRDTIRCIGRVASDIPEQSDACLQDLLMLISHKQEEVVAESVIIMRHLLQKQAQESEKDSAVSSVVKKLAKLLDTITVPVARGSIIWLVGEFYTAIPQFAPDVFRKLAKTFVQEDDIAKLQVLGLGTKLYLSDFESKKVKKVVHEIFQYVLQLAKYDLNYDVRDRCRVIKTLLFSKDLEEEGAFQTLRAKAKEILMCEKEPPTFDSKPQDKVNFQLGSLSHIMSHTVIGYCALPDFPAEGSDPELRKTEEEKRMAASDMKDLDGDSDDSSWLGSSDDEETDSDDSDEEEEDEEEDSSDDESGDESGSESGSGSEDESGSESGGDDDSEDESGDDDSSDNSSGDNDSSEDSD